MRSASTMTKIASSNFVSVSLLCAVFVLFNIASAQAATTFGFERVTSNNAEDLSDQLSITVWSNTEANSQFGLGLASSQILFTVQNDVGIVSSVSEVYFDDGLLGPSVVANSLGGFTDFTGGGANPGNLPGGNTIGFLATSEFSADAVGNPSKGVNTSADILGIILGLGGFADYSAVVAAVNSGELRFGYHIRAIGSQGSSDSYVNTVVPLPAAAWLFGSALLGVLGMKSRK